MPKHPALEMSFDELYDGLYNQVLTGNVHENVSGDGLSIFTYSKDCVCEKNWNKFTSISRGLILDVPLRKIVALPFPKFFNYGEQLFDQDTPFPGTGAFQTFEKMDGSLIILFNYRGEWRTATKGSFESDQAKWAANWIKNRNLNHLDTECTYLMEAIYPENKVVIPYTFQGLIFLGAYDNLSGEEFSWDYVEELAHRMGWKAAKQFYFKSISEITEVAKFLEKTEEGFVVRWENGFRLKIKGEEYKRIHALVSNLSPLSVWEMLYNGATVEEMHNFRKMMPEELWDDFDNIYRILSCNYYEVEDKITDYYHKNLENLSDKEMGLMEHQIPTKLRHFMFPYRKLVQTGKSRTTRLTNFAKKVWREVRPKNNELEGYTPSYMVGRVQHFDEYE